VQSGRLLLDGLRFSMLSIRLEAMSRILFAIDRSNVRRVPIEVGSPNPKLFFVRIDPFPQLLTGSQSLSTSYRRFLVMA